MEKERPRPGKAAFLYPSAGCSHSTGVVSCRTVNTTKDIAAEILELKKKRNAVILAHSYQRPEVQDIADFVGDSLGLARKSNNLDADVIVFCGVHFMAETAAILAPTKRVLLPDIDAGCSLAATISASEMRQWKSEHPDAVVVSYVNTSAEVKALTDYCCTSSNAVSVVNAIPADKEVLFCPDMFLGQHVKQQTGRTNMHIWAGECHVHAGLKPAVIQKKLDEHSEAEFLMHPECGCTSDLLYLRGTGEACTTGAKVLSTEGMVNYAKKSSSSGFVIATETGILHRLKQMNPGKNFWAVNDLAVCRFMKMITIEKVLRSLKEDMYHITVPPAVAERASQAIQRMVEIG
ncbi:MAG: quinolinate synthase NadA [Kiritimatiellae bacterium]|nr:quinolinate synthase NadA [Kiritimatiellia bacterium]